jgi:hypothetical protein
LAKPGKPYPMRVTVQARRNGDNWTFVMRDQGHDADRLDFSKDAAGMRKPDWHEIDFMLNDPSGTLSFHPDKGEAIWVARGSEQDAPPCPDRRHPRDKAVYPLWVKDRQLRVCNRNDERCLLSFRLNFVAAGSHDATIIASHDPIMGNANGGSD